MSGSHSDSQVTHPSPHACCCCHAHLREFIPHLCLPAHIDHGKTTLMDRLLAQCGQGQEADRAMVRLLHPGRGLLSPNSRWLGSEILLSIQMQDSNTLEKERGITILAKYTSFRYKSHLVNALDTPGHADFGGEVERWAT